MVVHIVFSYEKILEICEKADALSQQEVDEVICGYYRKSKYISLDQLTEKWFNLYYFKRMEHLIEDAYYAHATGKYTLSIPVWYIVIEGVLREFYKDNYQLKYHWFGNLKSDLKSKVELLENYFLNYAIKQIDYFFADSDNRKSYNDIERNNILHGRELNYGTEVNSIKLILFLDEIYRLIQLLKLKNIQD